MDEYIKREDVIFCLDEIVRRFGCNYSYGLTFARREASNIPAADVVPVVRCADCKWIQNNMRQDGYLPKGVSEWECRHWCGACDPTDFCSYGARMDGDGDV